MTFESWVRDHVGEDRESLAQSALAEVPELLVRVVAEAIDNVRREDARRDEAATVRQFLKTVASQPAIDVGRAAIRLLVLPVQPFALGDGSRVTWAEATPEQHEQRATMLRSQVAGLVATAHLHEEAAERLRGFGARSLGELLERHPDFTLEAVS